MQCLGVKASKSIHVRDRDRDREREKFVVLLNLSAVLLAACLDEVTFRSVAVWSYEVCAVIMLLMVDSNTTTFL